MAQEVTFRRATAADAGVVADLYLRARKAAVPAIPPLVHGDEDVRRYVATVIIRDREVWVSNDLAGFLALDEDWIDHLYLDPDRTGRGIGSMFVDLAKARRPDGLQLWAFQSNVRALRFYERHGFVAESWTDGDNEEEAPDVRYRWRPA